MSAFLKKYIAQFDMDSILSLLLTKGLSLLVTCLAFYIVKRLIRFSVKRVIAPSVKFSSETLGRQKTIIRLTENILNYFLYFILLYVVLSILGVPMYSLLAGAGIAGVAIGLGAQGFLSDLVNGFFILIERQFDVGDSVRLTNGSIKVAGTIVSVGIRTTQVRDADGTLHFIPNRNILVVSNQSRGDMRAQIDIPLYATTDLNQVAQIIEAVNQRELGQFEAIKTCTILGAQMTTSGQFSYRIHFVVEQGQQTAIYHAFYAFYQEALIAAGVDLPTLSSLPSTAN